MYALADGLREDKKDYNFYNYFVKAAFSSFFYYWLSCELSITNNLHRQEKENNFIKDGEIALIQLVK